MAAIAGTTVAAFQTALVAVTAAVASGDYAGAHVEVLNASCALAGMPLTNVKEGLTAQMRSDLRAVTTALQVAERRSAGARFEKHSRLIP